MYRLNYSPSLVPYPLASMCIVWDRDFVYFHLLDYLLNWVFHSKQTEISICIFSKQDCAQEIPAVWPGIVGMSAIIDAASSLELAGQGKDFIVVCWVFFLLNIATFSFSFIWTILLKISTYQPGLHFFLACCWSPTHIFLYCYALWKGGRRGAKMDWFLQRSARGKGRPTGLIPVTLTNVRYSSRPFQPGRLHTLVSAPGEAMSWNVPHHLPCCLQTTCPVNALSASKYCAIKSGLTCSESLAPRKH